MTRRAVFAAAIFLAAVTQASAEPPPLPGVYECMDQRGVANPLFMFGLLDGSTYADWNGKTGHYVYDAGRRVVTMVDGPFRGARYRRGPGPDPARGADNLRLLNDAGQLTAMNCPHNHVKDAHRHPW